MDGRQRAVLGKVQKHDPNFKTTEKSVETGWQKLHYVLSTEQR